VIYRFPEETREITCDTEPIGAVIIDAPEQWVAAVNEVIEKQREVFMKYLEYKPVDEKYAELRERLAVKQLKLPNWAENFDFPSPMIWLTGRRCSPHSFGIMRLYT
jgi:hypothetical protein